MPYFQQLSVTLFLTFCSYCTFGQYNETIRSERPGQAVDTYSTGQYIFQLQTGLTYGGFDDLQSNQAGNFTEYGASLRYGILEDFEIRSAIRWRSDQTNLPNGTETKINGISFWNVGVKYNIISGSGYKPSFGLQTDLKLTWVDEAYQSQEIAPRIMLIHGQKLSDTFNLTTNWAIAWSGNDDATKGLYILNIAFPLSDKLGGFVENYGEIDNGNIDTRWDTGLSYLVNNDFQLDVSGGFGSNAGINDWFMDAGISWRVKVK